MLVLVYNPGYPDQKGFRIDRQSVVIGRSSDHEICIPHKSLSRNHARIELSGNRFFLIDLDSKNGTFVNGVRIKNKEIRPGDAIKLGDLFFTLASEQTRSQQITDELDPREASARTSPPFEPRPHLERALETMPLEALLDESRQGGALKVKHTDSGTHTRDRLRILLEVSKLLSVRDGIDTLLRKIVDLLLQILDADRAAILLVDENTGQLVPRVAKSVTGRDDRSPIYSQHIVDYVRRKSLAVLFSDAAADPRLDTAKSIIHQSIRASMCVPLKPKSEVIGVLYVDNLSVPNRFSEEDLDFVTAFGSQAAVAIENSMLYRRIEQETTTRMQLIMEAKLASLSALVAGIAHEIRNPLNFVNNFAELAVGLVGELSAHLAAQRDRLDPAALRAVDDALILLEESVTKIDQHGRRADAVIGGMLLHARDTSAVREPADLNAVVEESVRLAHKEMRSKGLNVHIDAEYDRNIGLVEMVSADISHVFINVINNSFYAMYEKKRAFGSAYSPLLTIRTADREDFADVHIRDNGTGIAPDIAPKIFDPFFTTKPPGEGMGLGLSLSHEIVVQGHQGMMRMETSQGEQTEFIVTLPKRARAASRK